MHFESAINGKIIRFTAIEVRPNCDLYQKLQIDEWVTGYGWDEIRHPTSKKNLIAKVQQSRREADIIQDFVK